ncbi:MAG TPA: hypothetical protein VMM79_01640, partial [Longimicrobiales bacterium]|nr:hypothetical protein [Longimicrobiales bacterium]
MQGQRRSTINSTQAALAAIMIGAAPLGAQAPAWTFTEDRRVGPPAAEFGAITDVALDGSGRLWIADGMAGELH